MKTLENHREKISKRVNHAYVNKSRHMYIRDIQQLLNPEHAKPQVKLHPVAKNEAVTILHPPTPPPPTPPIVIKSSPFYLITEA